MPHLQKSTYQGPNDLLRRMMIDNAASGNRESPDALVQRILDDAASRQPPMGLFDPRESHRLQATSSRDFGSAFATPADPQFPSSQIGSDALVLRILDEAGSKQPPIGLFGRRESDGLEAIGSPDFRSAFPMPADPQFPSPRSGSDGLVQRVLGDQSPTALVDPRGYLPWPTAYNTSGNTSRGDSAYDRWSKAFESLERAHYMSQSLPAYAVGRAASDAAKRTGPTPQTSNQLLPGSPLPFRGDLSAFDVVSRMPGGGASGSDAYKHWSDGSGETFDLEFSDANIADLERIMRESAAGKLRGSIQRAINETVTTGLPVYVDTTAPIDTGDSFRGRVNSALRGWVTAENGQWQFDGMVTGNANRTGTPERFDFNSDPARGYPLNAGTIYIGELGHYRGARDYDVNYVGGIRVNAGGAIRR